MKARIFTALVLCWSCGGYDADETAMDTASSDLASVPVPAAGDVKTPTQPEAEVLKSTGPISVPSCPRARPYYKCNSLGDCRCSSNP